MKPINISFSILLLTIIIFSSIINALPENKKCSDICRNVNRGCTNNCIKSGGSEDVCGNLCSSKAEGCFYKCLYINNCSKK